MHKSIETILSFIFYLELIVDSLKYNITYKWLYNIWRFKVVSTDKITTHLFSLFKLTFVLPIKCYQAQNWV